MCVETYVKRQAESSSFSTSFLRVERTLVHCSDTYRSFAD